jgi:hypothetical protein
MIIAKRKKIGTNNNSFIIASFGFNPPNSRIDLRISKSYWYTFQGCGHSVGSRNYWRIYLKLQHSWRSFTSRYGLDSVDQVPSINSPASCQYFCSFYMQLRMPLIIFHSVFCTVTGDIRRMELNSFQRQCRWFAAQLPDADCNGGMYLDSSANHAD